ncbi:MAG: type I polyketide synthase, partial [Blastocatellia bacterium]|nr:type I polyketide synthase [Blastocatellia bacterium]
MESEETLDNLYDIAVIGMAGRFPKAKNIEQFWENLKNGVEGISFFSDEELIASGISEETLKAPNYVKAKGWLDDIEMFDASFFGYSPKEAEIMDPQHRFLLEVAWEVLENAGYDPARYTGAIAVYAGLSTSSYILGLYSDPKLMESADIFQVSVGNDRDHAPTHVSYKFNLKGPSINVQTACSTSLVAVHLACQSLLTRQCDMAIVGGVSIGDLKKSGYWYTEGSIYSPDGHCRAFDEKGAGTLGGSGVGLVLLKRMQEALQDGDSIRAVIKGSAINNDGSLKVGYTAPSVEGQAEVIEEALAVAGVEPETVTYVEAHGTATNLGDPIEVAALTKSFRKSTDKKGFCGLGSVKSNIGHLDVAAGVTGLIKTILSLEKKMLPPSLHFQQPNSKIDFEHSPFYVNSSLKEWKRDIFPRRAGVSSFGIGGTNAHVIVEEAPEIRSSSSQRRLHILPISAKHPDALEQATSNLAAHLKVHKEQNLADVAHTLQVGRQAFRYRKYLLCSSTQEAISILEGAGQVFASSPKTVNPST